jgi:drug/metabolite transporter (DMT)-like permease
MPEIEASIGGLLGLLEIVFSILLGILIFHEVLTVRVIIGGTIIILAAVLPHIADLLHKNSQSGKFSDDFEATISNL